MTVAKAFELAVEHHRGGRLAHAESLYRQVVEQDPKHEKALYLLGSLALESGRSEVAVPLLERAVALKPKNPAFHTDLGLAYRRLGQFQKAVEAFTRAIALKPDAAESYFNLGLALLDIGELDGASTAFERAVDLKPDVFVMQLRLARTLRDRGDPPRALGHYHCALALNPASPEARGEFEEIRRSLGRSEEGDLAAAAAASETALSLGLSLMEQGEVESALTYLERAADLKPDAFVAQMGLARALEASGDRLRAIGHYHAAMVLDPSALELCVDLAEILKSFGRADGAEALCRRIIARKPLLASAHNELGNVLIQKRQLDPAISAYRKAVDVDPSYALGYTNLGAALLNVGLVDEAIQCLGKSITLKPSSDAHSNLVYALSFHPDSDQKSILEEARAFHRIHAAQLAAEMLPHENERSPGRRLRIGYVSPDFREHPLANLVAHLMTHHDRKGHEIFCYSSVENPDRITRLFERGADVYRYVCGMSDLEVAALVRRDAIDILVDLTMHMDSNRFALFACKPAPVQACWFAYPGTTGLEAMDYRITDSHIDPAEWDLDALYSEKSIHVGDTFWCYDPLTDEPLPVGPLPALKNGYVTFGYLNAFNKTNRRTLELWARVLKAVDGSRLIVLVPPGDSRKRTRAAFEECGVDGNRIRFADRMSRDRYLAAYNQIDLILDSLPYNGHTTSLDALWMGVPVVTLVGDTVVGRAGYCYARNLDLPELIARTPSEYVERCRALTGDLPRLAKLRAELRDRMTSSPLMDAPRFARNLEAAFRTMWTNWCDGGAVSPMR